MIVTIDGPAGSGKSTTARGLAARLGFQFLDTGAMYRVVGLLCEERGVDLHDATAVADVARSVEITLEDDRVFADGRDVTAAIRTPEVSRAASVVAVNAEVREALVRLQRLLAKGRNVVTEGRDQGTVVFPDAECKFYLTADPRERAARRQRELQQQGTDVSQEELIAEIRTRDLRDANRKVAPLKSAPDAIHVDTSHQTIEEVLDLLAETVRKKLAERK